MSIYCFIKYTDDPTLLNKLKSTNENRDAREVARSHSKLFPVKESLTELKYDQQDYYSSTATLNEVQDLQFKKISISLEYAEKPSIKAKHVGSSKVHIVSETGKEEIKKKKSEKMQSKTETKSEISKGSLLKKAILDDDNLYKNKTLMVNPDCYVQTLLDYIYVELKIDKNLKMDLADENGILMRMDLLQQYDSALRVLQDKKTYIAVVFERDNNERYSLLTPILKKATKEDTDFFIKLLKNANSSNRKGSQSFKSSRSSLKSARSSTSRVERLS